MLIGNVYLVIDKQTKLGMGTIDEVYVNNNNNDNNGSDSEVINRTKFPTMIPSTVPNSTNLTASETVKSKLNQNDCSFGLYRHYSLWNYDKIKNYNCLCFTDETLNRLKYESSRLLTFDKWPASAKVEPRKIAKAGFYYTGQYAEAKCLWCDYVITTWEYGDQVYQQSREIYIIFQMNVLIENRIARLKTKNFNVLFMIYRLWLGTDLQVQVRMNGNLNLWKYSSKY